MYYFISKLLDYVENQLFMKFPIKQSVRHMYLFLHNSVYKYGCSTMNAHGMLYLKKWTVFMLDQG